MALMKAVCPRVWVNPMCLTLWHAGQSAIKPFNICTLFLSLYSHISWHSTGHREPWPLHIWQWYLALRYVSLRSLSQSALGSSLRKLEYQSVWGTSSIVSFIKLSLQSGECFHLYAYHLYHNTWSILHMRQETVYRKVSIVFCYTLSNMADFRKLWFS